MNNKSIFKYASEAGLPMGIYLTIISACLLLSIQLPPLGFLVTPLTIGFPFMIWFLLKRIVQIEPSYMKLSTLWLGGIYTVIFGTLICMFLTGLYLVFVNPGFINEYARLLIVQLEEADIANEYAPTIAILKNAVSSGALPTGMDFNITMGWLTSFSGSVLSLIIAFLMTSVRRKAPQTQG